jgi:predicted acetyltransferase
MEEAQEVTLDAATPCDDALLSNLLELYIHDLSAPFPDIEMGANGRFGYRKLPLYWSEPDRRFAFVIRCGGRLAGFALATRGSPVTEDPDVLDVAEFFVLRRYRRAGVGRQAAFLLWNRLPGKWTVRVFEGVPGAVVFWRSVIVEFTHGTVTEHTRPGDSTNAWRVFSFESPPRARATGRPAPAPGSSP